MFGRQFTTLIQVNDIYLPMPSKASNSLAAHEFWYACGTLQDDMYSLQG
ncbi:hypothetical protein ACUXST_000066 [Sphingomonas sp. F9_3S_D5_B_2]